MYIYDDVNADDQTLLGEASSWWLHNSLKAFNESLNDKVSFFRGDPLKILTDLTEKYNIKNIFWNRLYEPWMINRDTEIKEHFQPLELMLSHIMHHYYGSHGRFIKMTVLLHGIFTFFQKRLS